MRVPSNPLAPLCGERDGVRGKDILLKRKYFFLKKNQEK
jgi:hypothetical protein